MNIVPVSPEALQQALDVLRAGGVVAHATETCYGLACDLKNPEAVTKLFTIKQRPLTQPISALFTSIEEAQVFLEWNEAALSLATTHLPGPLTIILKAKAGCPLYVTPSGGDSIGVRISPHNTATQLVARFGSPLSTTSANIHGMPNPYCVADVEKQYANKAALPDLILDDGPLAEAPASTVINVSDGAVHVLRQGKTNV